MLYVSGPDALSDAYRSLITALVMPANLMTSLVQNMTLYRVFEIRKEGAINP
jgi:hypothetical protein